MKVTELKIIEIKQKPWWKLWTVDNIEVTLEDPQGNQKTLTVYQKVSSSPHLLKEYIAEKYCTGDQFWTLNQRAKKEKKAKKTKKLSETERVLQKAISLIGESFDCALVLSKDFQSSTQKVRKEDGD